MISSILNYVYLSGTRSVRVFNAVYHLVWSYLISMHLAGILDVAIPPRMQENLDLLLALLVITVLTSLVSFAAQEPRVRTLFKFVSLLFGALIQLIIASRYVNNYPPFDVMIIVSSTLALWFFGGALYVQFANNKGAKKYGCN